MKHKYGDTFRGWMPSDIVKALGFRAYNDPNELKEICLKVVENHKDIASQYCNGNAKVIGRLIKHVMDETQNGANPTLTTELLKGLLENGF